MTQNKTKQPTEGKGIKELEKRCETAEKLLDDLVMLKNLEDDDLNIIYEIKEIIKLRIKEGKPTTAFWHKYFLNFK